jgi:hypothetical protein
MKLTIRFLVAFVLALTLAGCTIPVMTKVEIKDKPVSEFQKKSNYLSLARYWDDHAEKQTIDFKGASFLTVWDREGKAEITIGNGPYYGMIELIKLDEQTTLVRCYSWDFMAKRIEEWKQLIQNASEDKKS